MKNLNVLITGGAGYIGSVLAPALLDRGYGVTILDSFMFKQASLAACCINPNFELVRGDARDRALVASLVKKVDAIIPLAALVGAPLCKMDPDAAVSINREAVRMLTELMSPNQYLLLPNTNSGYGVGEEGAFCTEDSPLRPISLYGTSKVEAELIALERTNTITFRLATVFGMSPRMRTDLLVNDFVYRAITDRAIVIFEGHFKRNYIHVRDVANAFIHGLSNFEAMRGKPYNLGLSSANLSKIELAQTIQAFVPGFTYLESPIGKDPDQRNYIVSNARIEATGFAPQFSLEDGIQELIKGYQMIRLNAYANV
jgi:nucleoside-diphosphate-sugar epimerase